MAKLKIRIYPDGTIKAETIGVKGKECTKYIPIIEQLTNAVTDDSEFTKDFYNNEQDLVNEDVQEVKL
ncbi:MAG: DUF2997 domain-containing protein [Ruminococcus sp.]|nr:DUF2997 domain-containing protein [Ruminococcus sp.]